MRLIRLKHILLSILLLIVGGVMNETKAQFHDMELLPWCPPRPDAKAGQADGAVLERLNEALLAGNYTDVVDRLYPLAISQGYQRNANLYNQTRRALRQLMQSEGGDRYWKSMQRLYHDRYANIGQDSYEYRNTLETRAWCDLQLDNERLLMLSALPGSEMECFDATQQLLLKCQGHADPVWVTQGMFFPLNRTHAQHPESGKDYMPRYNEVLKWIEATENYMQVEHPEAYHAYYNAQTLALAREESQRQLSADAAIAELENRRQQQQDELRAHYDSINTESRSQRLYAEALDLYKKQKYADAYTRVNELLAQDGTREAHVLKSNILQAAANATQDGDDKVAFWCAAYEAGRGYVDQKTLNSIASALRSRLFMSGLAGKTHTTKSPIRLHQRVWTLEQLRNI